MTTTQPAAPAPRLPADLDFTELKPALDAVASSMALEAMPKSTPLPDPEEVVSQYLKGVDPCEAAATTARLERQLVAQQAAAASMNGFDGAEAIEQAVVSTEAALARMRKQPRSTESMRLALVQAKDRFVADQSRKRDVATKGAASAALRLEERHKQLESLKTQLEGFAAAMMRVETEYAAAHTARNALREQLATQVQALFDLRIAGAATAAEQQQQQPAAAAATTTTAPTAPATPAAAAAAPAAGSASSAGLDAVQQAARDADAMRRRVVDLEAQVKRACDLHAAFAQKAQREVVLTGLPEVPVPDEPAKKLHKRLLAFLERWSNAGEVLPFCLGDLGRCVADEPATAVALKALLGPFWTAWFAEQATSETIVPKQAAQVLHTALERVQAAGDLDLDAETTPAEEDAEMAERSYAALAAKRARLE